MRPVPGKVTPRRGSSTNGVPCNSVAAQAVVPAHLELVGLPGHRGAEQPNLAGHLCAGADGQHLTGSDANDLFGPRLLHATRRLATPTTRVDEATRSPEAVQAAQIDFSPDPAPPFVFETMGTLSSCASTHANDEATGHVFDSSAPARAVPPLLRQSPCANAKRLLMLAVSQESDIEAPGPSGEYSVSPVRCHLPAAADTGPGSSGWKLRSDRATQVS